ncbi:hypothetical protein FACS189427_12000 [Planctomycetales bacterium]|nr:hypothetical protein FACS189427_12000 [Planctomycetales bacterium]
MKRYERILYLQEGIKFFDTTYDAYAELVKKKSEFALSPASHPYQPPMEILTYFEIACLKHVEIPVDKTLEDVAFFLRRGVAESIEFFWRVDNGTNAYIRKQEPGEWGWAFKYPLSLMCALWIADEHSLIRIAQWADETVLYCPDAGVSKMDTLFYIILSRFICTYTLEDNRHLIEVIRSNRAQRPKLLIDILEAIDKSDDIALKKAVEKYMNHYLKKELDLNTIEGSISLYTSLLWETARRNGITLPLLSDDIMDRIVPVNP